MSGQNFWREGWLFLRFSRGLHIVILVGLLRLVVAKAYVMAQLDAVLSPRVGGLVREWLLPAGGSGLADLNHI